ncbi:hypothetical protein BLD50_06715 [Bacillus cereus]|nr:hypothetical protein BLD50_06715 [Bacillus cereus]
MDFSFICIQPGWFRFLWYRDDSNYGELIRSGTNKRYVSNKKRVPLGILFLFEIIFKLTIIF